MFYEEKIHITLSKPQLNLVLMVRIKDCCAHAKTSNQIKTQKLASLMIFAYTTWQEMGTGSH